MEVIRTAGYQDYRGNQGNHMGLPLLGGASTPTPDRKVEKLTSGVN
jgi:hypothetical protein